MRDSNTKELEENFYFFQGLVKDLMSEHAGQYVLLRRKHVVDIYNTPLDAAKAGHSRYGDGLFSVQRVIDKPFDLGFMAYGSSDGSAN